MSDVIYFNAMKSFISTHKTHIPSHKLKQFPDTVIGPVGTNVNYAWGLFELGEMAEKELTHTHTYAQWI